MTTTREQIQQLEAAIAAQESLRPLLGDTVVAVSVQALQAQLAQLQGYLPPELAAKIRALGRIEGERRQVTILFADLSGFTALSEQLDPEEMTAIMNDALQEMAQAVYAWEGYIDKFIGDAVMAVFGAPIAHEDDPERALRAALAMRAQMDGLNRRHQARLPAPLTLHIGINTGLVIAGTVGSDSRQSYTMMGDSVNTAARLEHAAQPNQILVSRTTYRLTQLAFTFAALDPILVKGKQEPVVVYELIAARRTPEKRRGVKDMQDVFLGREAELSRLQDLAAALGNGHGHVVVVSGEAGMGKSRLMATWRQQLADQAVWVEGRAFHHTTTLPYGPFLDLLRRVVGIKDEDAEAQARARFTRAIQTWEGAGPDAPALLALLLGLALQEEERRFLDSLADDRIRRRLRDALTAFLLHLGQDQPMVLVLEDMHWADTSSLELIEHLLPHAAGRALIVVLVLRSYSSDMPSRLSQYLEDLAPDRRTHLALQPLSTDQSTTMVQRLLGQTALPPALTHILTAKAEGNPFFVEEVLRMLIDRGALIRDPAAGWVATSVLDQLTVPDTLQGVVMARLDRLYPETKWVLQQAAVIGRIFLYRVLIHLEGTRDLDTDLSLLEREELIRERARDPEIEYIFKHALTQEVAYQSLLAARRKDLHRRTAETIEQLFADRLSEFYPILAKHFSEGEAWESAIDYLIRSGDLATRLYAHPEARSHYHAALRALAHLPITPAWQRMRVDTTIRLVKVGYLTEAPQVSVDRLLAAEAWTKDLLEQAEDDTADRLRLARVHYWMGTTLVLHVGGLPAAIPYFAQVLPIAQATDDAELLVVPSMIMGRGLTVRGNFVEACPLFVRILPLLAQAEDWTEWILTTVFLGLAQAACGDYVQGVQAIVAARDKAYALGNTTGQVYGHMFLAAASVHGGDSALMLAESQRAFQAAVASGDRLYEYFSAGYQAWAYSRLGDHAAAARWLATCMALCETLGGQLVLSDWFAAAAAEVALNAGDWQVAQERAAAAVDQAGAIGGIFALGLAERIWAQALMAGGVTDRARLEPHLAASVAALGAGGARLEAARSHAVWAEVCLKTADAADAARYRAEALAPLREAGLDAEAGLVEDYLARM
jgi:class 3 adenylate cyclase